MVLKTSIFLVYIWRHKIWFEINCQDVDTEHKTLRHASSFVCDRQQLVYMSGGNSPMSEKDFGHQIAYDDNSLMFSISLSKMTESTVNI